MNSLRLGALMRDDLIIICRCEDVTLADVKRCLKAGYTNFEDLKRQLRVGMGPCQGQTCSALIQREIANFTKKKMKDVPIQKTRPLIIGVKLNAIKDGATDES